MDRGTWWATVHRVTELGIPKATYTIRGWVVLRSQCMVHTFSQFLLNYNHHTPNTFLLTESFSGFPNVYQLSQASLATNKQQQNLQFYLPFVFFATRKKLETKIKSKLTSILGMKNSRWGRHNCICSMYKVRSSFLLRNSELHYLFCVSSNSKEQHCKCTVVCEYCVYI